MSSTDSRAPEAPFTDARNPRALIEAAEEAATAGDHPAAERLLREAALLQEATLGPLHPDLANTLNNLGVVCEITDNPVDAEHYFRRACAIATAVLPPDHPFVATSRKNLEDFCAARGKDVKLPAAVSFVTGAPWNVPAGGPEDGQANELPVNDSPQAAVRAVSNHRRLVTSLVVGGLFATLAIAMWFRSSDRGEPPSTSVMSSAGGHAAAESPTVRTPPVVPPEPAAIEPARPPVSAPKAGPSTAGRTTARRQTAAGQGEEPSARTVPAPVVAVAQLCRTLATRSATWQCVPAESPVGAGPLFFYTRLRSSTSVTVQHRWYRNDRVRQVVELPIRANMLDGYRTYSRQTVDGQGAGDWRVELRTADGTLLHEERFAAR